jgi:hypothetical protein
MKKLLLLLLRKEIATRFIYYYSDYHECREYL